MLQKYMRPIESPLTVTVPPEIMDKLRGIKKTVPRQVACFFRESSLTLMKWQWEHFSKSFQTESRVVTFLVDRNGKAVFSLPLHHGNPPINRSAVVGALAGLSSSGKLRKIVAIVCVGEDLLEGDDFAIVAPFVAGDCKVIGVNGKNAISGMFHEQYKPLRWNSQTPGELRQVEPRELPIFFATELPAVALLDNQEFLAELDEAAQLMQQNGFSNGKDRPATKGHVAFAFSDKLVAVANNRRLLTRRLCNCAEPGALQLLYSARRKWADAVYVYSSDYKGTALPVVCPQCLGHLEQAHKPGGNLMVVSSNGSMRRKYFLEEMLPHSYLKAEGSK